MGKGSKKTMPSGKSQVEKKLPVRLIVASAVVLVLIFVVMAIEAVNTERLIIINNTAADIEWIHLYFESMNDDDDYHDILSGTDELSIAAGQRYKGSFTAQSGFSSYRGVLIIEVKFAGMDAAGIYAGAFTRAFNGKIRLEFSDMEDGSNILVKIKAGDGIFQSTKFTGCDETQELFEPEE